MRVIGNIFEEDNYNAFVRLKDNRDVLSSRVNKLIASISERYIINPIIVNEKMEIIDGQGRYEARKALGKPIHYIISTGADSTDCRRMNKYNSKWTSLDFAKSYAKSGLPAYVFLLKTCKETAMPLSRVLRLANHGTNTSKQNTTMSVFEKGELIFKEDDIIKVCNIKKIADDVLDALQFNGRINDAFYIGIKIASETDGYDHSKMIANCRKQRASYTQMSGLSDQLKEMERIYNYKTRQGNKLYFSDYMRNKGANVRDYKNSYSPYTDTDASTLKED